MIRILISFLVLENAYCICTYAKFDMCTYMAQFDVHICTLISNRYTKESQKTHTHTFPCTKCENDASLYTYLFLFTSIALSQPLFLYFNSLFGQKLIQNRTNKCASGIWTERVENILSSHILNNKKFWIKLNALY